MTDCQEWHKQTSSVFIRSLFIIVVSVFISSHKALILLCRVWPVSVRLSTVLTVVLPCSCWRQPSLCCFQFSSWVMLFRALNTAWWAHLITSQIQTLTWSVFLSAEDKGASARPNAKDREAFNAKNILQVRNVIKTDKNQINAVLLNFLFICESWKIKCITVSTKILCSTTVFNIDNNQKCFLRSKSAYYYDFWRSCDTEDCSNDAENTALITEINYSLTHIIT